MEHLAYIRCLNLINSWMFIAAFFIIIKNWKQSKCPSTGKTVEYYSTIKRNELLIHTTTQLNLKCITYSLREAWPKRLQTVQFYLYDILEKAIQKTENRDIKQISSCQGTGETVGYKGTWGDFLEVIAMFLIMGVVIWLNAFVKIHRTVL